MLWLPLALAAPVAWAVGNVLDAKLVKDTAVAPTLICAAAGLQALAPLAFGLYVHGPPEAPSSLPVFVALAAGFVGVLVYLPYLHALTHAEAAEANAMWTFSPAIAAVLAAVTLSERLPLWGYAGVALLIAAALIAGWRGPGTIAAAGRPRAALLLMATASLLFAVEGVLQKAVFESTSSYWDGALLISGSSVLAGVVLLTFRRRTPGRRWPRGRTLGLIATNQLLDVAAGVCVMTAISLGPVSGVRAVGALQPLFVMAVAPMFLRRRSTAPPPGGIAYRRLLLSVALGLCGVMLVNGFGE